MSYEPYVSPTTPKPSPAPLEFKVAFTYMMGFEDPNVQSSVLENQRTDIMGSTSGAIVNILNGSDGRRLRHCHLLEKLTIPNNNNNNNGVEHKFYQDTGDGDDMDDSN